MDATLRQDLARIGGLLSQMNGDELLINGSRGSFVTTRSTSIPCSMPFTSIDRAADFARELAWQQGLRLDPHCPSAGGSVAEFQFRWHAIIHPLAQDEIILSVRRHRFDEIELTTFHMSAAHLMSLEKAVLDRRPILIVGGTGAGKTTLLMSVLKKYFLDSRVIIMESLSEIPAISPSWLRMSEVPVQASGKGGVSLTQVGRECLRLRPDVLVIGEIRGPEAQIYFDMSQTGHGGCLATMHAGSLEQAAKRLIDLADRQATGAIELNILGIFIEKDGKTNLPTIQAVTSLK